MNKSSNEPFSDFKSTMGNAESSLMKLLMSPERLTVANLFFECDTFAINFFRKITCMLDSVKGDFKIFPFTVSQHLKHSLSPPTGLV